MRPSSVLPAARWRPVPGFQPAPGKPPSKRIAANWSIALGHHLDARREHRGGRRASATLDIRPGREIGIGLGPLQIGFCPTAAGPTDGQADRKRRRRKRAADRQVASGNASIASNG